MSHVALLLSHDAHLSRVALLLSHGALLLSHDARSAVAVLLRFALCRTWVAVSPLSAMHKGEGVQHDGDQPARLMPLLSVQIAWAQSKPPITTSPQALYSFSLTAISCVRQQTAMAFLYGQQGVSVWKSIRDAAEGVDTVPWIPTKHSTAVLRGQQCQGNERLWSQRLAQNTLRSERKRKHQRRCQFYGESLRPMLRI